MNLDITQRCLKQKKELEYFHRKENSSNIKKEKCYNCDIKEYYMNKCRKLKKT